MLYLLLEGVHAVEHKAYQDPENGYTPAERLRDKQVKRKTKVQKYAYDWDYRK
jgi:hypothetical protein